MAIPFFLHSQSASGDLYRIVDHVQEQNQKNINSDSVHLQKSYNPIKAFLYLSIYFYQQVLSEQLSAGCEFDRSCSNFSLMALNEFGSVKGVSLSADRLTRCNGQAQMDSEEYLINHSNGKTIDEPWMYRFKK